MRDSDISDEVWKAIFTSSLRGQHGWWFSAYKLRRVAELAYDAAEEAGVTLRELVHNEVPLDGELALVEPAPEEEVRLAFDGDLHTVGHMLMALAIENLGKALIARRPEFGLANEKLPMVIRGHNLLRIVSEAGLELDIQERVVLEQLQTFSVWRGRYPVPVRWENLRDRRRSMKQLQGMREIADVSPRAIAGKILERLEEEVKQTATKSGRTAQQPSAPA